jgi:hypothetical protein
MPIARKRGRFIEKDQWVNAAFLVQGFGRVGPRPYRVEMSAHVLVFGRRQ